MYTVRSADGTGIAYDRSGEGPAVILVSGAMGYRRFKKFEQIATALSEHCTVINYDRRGRGDSGPAGAVCVQHEVDDIAALIDAVGGRASLCRWSSGGAVALRAAAADIGVERLVLRGAIQDRSRRQVPGRRLRCAPRTDRRRGQSDARSQALHAQRHRDARRACGRDDADADVKTFAAKGLTLTFDHAALGHPTVTARAN